ncbi:MAG: hypothetical protein AAFX08_06215 [Pseudomonadota bacterium]
MTILKWTAFATISAFLLGLAATYALGAVQPSTVLQKHETIVFVAVRKSASSTLDLDASDKALWRSRAAFPLIGADTAYWTEFLIFPDDGALSELTNAEGDVLDIFAAEVALVRVPALALGLLRGRHLLGLARRPSGALPKSIDEIDGRKDVLPTDEAIRKLTTATPERQLTMMNFLAYFPESASSPEGGRAAYRRYGMQAMQSVHQVGGQFLFAGRIARVLIDARSGPTMGEWDDLAAMMYPDPTAILYMEQIPAYQKALADRDRGLSRTVVIASEAHK